MKSYTPFLLSAFLLLAAGCGTAPNSSVPAPPRPAASSVSPAVPQISAESDSAWKEAEAAYQSWDMDRALSLCDKALSLDPRNYKAMSTKGVVIAFRTNPDDGIPFIKNALALAPEYTAAFYDMAMACKLAGRQDEAIGWFQKVLDKDPENTWSYYGIFSIYADRGDKASMLKYLKKAAALDPDAVKQAAKEQDHFVRYRNDPDFRAVVS